MRMWRRSRPRTRRAQRGFSILEALVAAGVLGIALTALVKLHTASMRGTVQSGRLGEATEVARGLADHFAMRAATTPLACSPGAGAPFVAMPACVGVAGTSPLSTNVGTACVSPNDCDAVIPPGGNGGGGCFFDYDVFGDATAPPAGEPINRRFRVRIMESQNPSGVGTRVTAIVCWRDDNSSQTRQIVSDRIVVPGI